MANNATTYLSQALLNEALRNTAFAQVAQAYLSLHTADPGKAGSHANEVSTSGTAYARVAITFGAPSANGNQQECSNSADINFATATADWGTVTHFGIEDGATEGADNMLFFGPLTTSKAVGNGDTFSVPTGDLTVDLG